MPIFVNNTLLTETDDLSQANGVSLDKIYFNDTLVYSGWDTPSYSSITEFPSDEHDTDIYSDIEPFTINDSLFTDINGNTSTGNQLTDTVNIDGTNVLLSDIFYNESGEFKYKSYKSGSFYEYCLKVKHNGLSFIMPSKSNWNTSYGSCADQHGGLYKTFSSNDIMRFKFYGEFTTDGSLPKVAFPKYSVSNSGLLVTSTSRNDANDISQTQFIWSFLGKTYKLVNTTKNKYLQVKDYGDDDSRYSITSVRNFTSASGYVYMRVVVGSTSSVHIGNIDGYLDFSRMKELVTYDGISNIIKPEYFYARNLHYAVCTYQTSYALQFQEI